MSYITQLRVPSSAGFILARWLVIGFALLQLGAVLVGIAKFPGYAAQQYADHTPNDNWTPEQTLAALQVLGWPEQSLAWIDLGRDVFSLGVTYVLGFILLRRKSRDWFGLYLALAFFMIGRNTGTAIQPAIAVFPALDFIFHKILGAVSWQFFFIAFFLFPTGRPVPAWTRWMIVAWFGYMPLSRIANTGIAQTVMGVLAFVFVFSAIGSQVYRQWKHSDAIQKQQTKWVTYALVIAAILMTAISPFAFREPAAASIGRDFILALIVQLTMTGIFLMIVLAILLAILRYRLYDIDVVIRRTLQFSLLSGLLSLVYFGGVAVLQGILTADRGLLTAGDEAVGGQPSAVVIVVTTLAIAALFNPLRRRVQDFIDRRFYRQKYDAEKALAEFAAEARSETDLSQLSAHLTRTVQETLQPEQVSLWLKTQRKETRG